MDILDADRHPGQRPGIAPRLDIAVELARGLARGPGGQGADRVEARVGARDLVQMRLDDGAGGDVAGAHAARDLGGGQAGKLLVGHGVPS
jgi:hypothetical protein